jgi:hypothetical protein
MVERVTEQMVACVADRKRLQQLLEEPDDRLEATNVFEQDQPTARTEHAPRLLERTTVVRNGAEGERADDRIEAFARKFEVLCIAHVEVDPAAECLRTGSSDLEHRRADIHGCQARLRLVVREISPRPDGNLQHISNGVRGCPESPISEEQTFGNPDD